MKKHIIDILSGILIAIGAYANLKVGGVIGAFLFSFGIVAIVGCNISLYTGIAGTDAKFIEKLEVLFMNLIGAVFGAFLILLCDTDIYDIAHKVCINKLIYSPLVGFFKAIMCGVIVDTAVYMSKDKQSFIPLILGIPVFILCGFNHSIADAAYFTFGGIEESFEKRFIFYYILCIIGNYIGCNFRRILTKLSFK